MKYLLAAFLAVFAIPAQAEFYINPFIGMAIFDRTVDLGTQRLPDQGGDALLGGLRAGWNSEGTFLYGVELEGFGANGRSRVMLNNGQTYTYDLNWGVGAYARAGWRTRGNALMFFRVGVLTTNQETQPDFGIGAQVPFGPGWAMRLDGGYTPGETYRITFGVVKSF